jgi:uncharacterized integral membrane protein
MTSEHRAQRHTGGPFSGGTDVSNRSDAEGRRISPKLIISLVAIVLLVIFWAQNRNKTKVTFWVTDATVRVWVALLIASVVGFIAGYFVRGSGKD